MRRQKTWFGIVLSLTLILAFQNCGQPSPVIKFTDTAFSSKNSDSGVSYDGKVYVQLGTACSDGSNVVQKIILRSFSEGSLVRTNCQDISPLPLLASDFQVNAANIDQLTFRSEVFVSQIPTGGTIIDASKAYLIAGFAYSLVYSFGTPADNAGAITQSRVLLFENGVALGPAHSDHVDIANLGLGRFAHWFDGTTEYLRFSASDNTNPATNGRVYSFKISN